MSSSGRARGIAQVDTGSNLVPVLGLRPLRKCPLGILSLAVTYQVLTDVYGMAESQGIIRVRSAIFIRPKQTKIWPLKGGL